MKNDYKNEVGIALYLKPYTLYQFCKNNEL